MTERLLIALVIVAGVTLAGFLARWLNGRRVAAVMSEETVDASSVGIPRVIAFSGPGCAACQTQRRILETVVAGWNETVDVAYVDAVAETELARRFGVMVVPTTVVAAPDGRIVGVNGGLVDGDRLRAQLAAA
jgi:thioredoxin-like negative regulator of GroEL